MSLRNNKGITMMDIVISLGIILLFSTLITGMIYNYAVSNKAIGRKTEAISIAVDIIEKLKNLNYENKIENVLVHENNVISETLTENGITREQDNENLKYFYKFSLQGLNYILDQSITDENEYLVKLPNGYEFEGKIEKYSENSTEKDDIMSLATIKISYLLDGKKENVELSTLIVKE